MPKLTDDPILDALAAYWLREHRHGVDTSEAYDSLRELLAKVRDGEREHLAVRPGRLQLAVALVARLAAAEVEVEREHAGVAARDGGIRLEGEGLA